MNMEEDFDMKLQNAFVRANAQVLPSEEFVDKVMQDIHVKNHRRTVILGGAATTGSAVTADQLSGLIENLHFNNPMLAQGFEMLGPDALIAFAFAVMAGVVAFVLPNRSF